MRRTMRPPAARAESHASRALSRFPTCMRPLGEGANRPVILFFPSMSIVSLQRRCSRPVYHIRAFCGRFRPPQNFFYFLLTYIRQNAIIKQTEIRIGFLKK